MSDVPEEGTGALPLKNALYEELKDDKAIGVTIMHRDAVRATE